MSHVARAAALKMDFSEGFSDGEAELRSGSPCGVQGQLDELDLLASFSDEDPANEGPSLLQAAAASALAIPDSSQTATDVAVVKAAPAKSKDYAGYSLKGKVGKGRHGSSVEQNIVCAHMRAEKRARRDHDCSLQLVSALQGCAFTKDGESFQVAATQGRSGGVKIVLEKRANNGNRFVRSIQFAKFIRASFGMNTSNVALSALLNIDSSTVPRLQKTVAGVFMASQTRQLARILAYCQQHNPVSMHRQLKWDETTVATTLSGVRSAWSVLVVRSRLLITWSSGATWMMRIVMPTIPLISCAADQMFYGLRRRPSFYAINEMVRLIGLTAQVCCSLREVDGAYANLRLRHHLLSLREYDGTQEAGSFLDTARCQSHATHLISVSLLALTRGNLINRLYALCVCSSEIWGTSSGYNLP